jgi:hypothetical protein
MCADQRVVQKARGLLNVAVSRTVAQPVCIGLSTLSTITTAVGHSLAKYTRTSRIEN